MRLTALLLVLLPACGTSEVTRAEAVELAKREVLRELPQVEPIIGIMKGEVENAPGKWRVTLAPEGWIGAATVEVDKLSGESELVSIEQ